MRDPALDPAPQDGDEPARAADPLMESRQMPFMEHLGELRVRLRKAALAYLVGTGVAYAFSLELFALLVAPLVIASQEAGIRPALNFLSPIEPFWVLMKLSMLGGLFLASPFIFWQLWAFIAPGLYRHERKIAVPVVAASAGLFSGGALFGHTYVLPAAYRFFLGYASKDLGRMREILGQAVDLRLTAPFELNPMLAMEQVTAFSIKMLLAFGIVFELPLVLSVLSWLGIVTAKGLWRFNRYALILSAVLGAVLTPGPDIASMLMMAIPMWALYNLSVVIALLFERRRARA